jgi:hypothetical protein
MRKILKFMKVATVCTSLLLSCQLIALGEVQKEGKVYHHENCTKKFVSFTKACQTCTEDGKTEKYCFSEKFNLRFIIDWFAGL